MRNFDELLPKLKILPCTFQDFIFQKGSKSPLFDCQDVVTSFMEIFIVIFSWSYIPRKFSTSKKRCDTDFRNIYMSKTSKLSDTSFLKKRQSCGRNRDFSKSLFYVY